MGRKTASAERQERNRGGGSGADGLLSHSVIAGFIRQSSAIITLCREALSFLQ
jgi:hypothetical protein